MMMKKLSRKLKNKLKNVSKKAIYILLAIFIAVSGIIWWPRHASATTDTFTTSGTWTVPANVSSAVFEAWGGGGAGGGSTLASNGDGGGAGGQYAIKTYTVTPGDNYTITVATAVAGTTGAGSMGNDSQVTDPLSTTVVLAKGGAGATVAGGGAGSSTGGIGDAVFGGGNGSVGGTSFSGGGGGGAGSSGAGGSASSSTAGTGTSSNGGNGGTGITANGNGNPGNNYGGGGSGAFRSSGPSRSGGGGAPGFVQVTYTPVSYTQSNYQWFTNANSTTPGSTLAAMSTSATLSSTGQPFRLRQLVTPSTSIPAGTNNYDEQYADLSSYGSCSAIPSGNWNNVGSGGGTSGSSGPLGAGAGANQTLSGSAWTNPGNITASDASFASDTINNGSSSDYLVATNFGFSIPSNATITGITVGALGGPSGVSAIADLHAQLVKGGVTQTTDRSSGAVWANSVLARTYGSSSDLWGGSWTPGDINASNFGFSYAVENVALSGSQTASVDYISITVNYSLPSSAGPNLTTSATQSTNGPNSIDWNNIGNITATDGVYATNPSDGSNVSSNLIAEAFGFSVPSSATIAGVSASIVGHANASLDAQDASIQLMKAGSTAGTPKLPSTPIPTSDSTRTYGSGSDLWGATLTPSDVNNSGFGVKYIDSAISNGDTVSVDSISITVYYTIPAIAYYDNPAPANGASITYQSGTDPTGNSPQGQTYAEANGFTTTTTTSSSVDGEWDLSLVDNAAPASTTYCFRTVVSGGAAFGTYSFYPQITTAPANSPPGAPTLSAPSAGATGVDATSPDFVLSSTDADSDHLQYKIVLYDSDCSSPPPPYGSVQTFDQTSDQTNWSGQDQDGGTTYSSGTAATYSFSGTPLNNNHTYCWKGAAIDPLGSATFSSYSGTQTFTTAAIVNHPVNVGGGVNIYGGTNIY